MKDYIEERLTAKRAAEEPTYFDHYDPEALANILETQRKLINFHKKRGDEKLFQILIIVDDLADDPPFARQSKLSRALYTRGRHNMISAIAATQKFSAIHPTIRVSGTVLFVYRLRSCSGSQTFIEEVTAVCDKKNILATRDAATEESFILLHVKLTAKKKDDMFHERFDQVLTVEHNQSHAN